MLAGVEFTPRRRRMSNFSTDRVASSSRYHKDREAPVFSPVEVGRISQSIEQAGSSFKTCTTDSTRHKEALAARDRLDGRLRAMELRPSPSEISRETLRTQVERCLKQKWENKSNAAVLMVGSSSQDCIAGLECPVCLEPLARRDLILCLPCKHKFHVNCVTKWIASNERCPYCRCQVQLP